MGSGPAPFSEIGRRARDLLTRDYSYDQKFSLSIPSSTGMILWDSQQLVSRRIKYFNVDTYSNVCTKVTYDVRHGAKAAISFNIPDQKSGKLDVHYLHHNPAINSSIGLNPNPLLEVVAAIGSKDIAIGGEIGFDTASSSFTKCNVGISFSKPDFSAAVILTDKGQTVKASYAHSVNPLTGTELAAEMTHRLSGFENSFSIGSVHKIDLLTSVKTRFSNNGKVAVLSQREWRPKSLVTVSAEYDTKATNVAPKFGLAIALKP